MRLCEKVADVIFPYRHLTWKEYCIKNAVDCSTVVSALTMSVGTLILHEYGHKYVGQSLFLNAKFKIHCEFSFGMRCITKTIGALRVPVGSIIGKNTRWGLMAAAGPIVNFISIAISSVVAWKCRKSYPKIARVFAVHASIMGLETAAYVTGIYGWKNWNDFLHIEKYLGIPFSVQSTVCVGIFLSTLLLRYLVSKAAVKNHVE